MYLTIPSKLQTELGGGGGELLPYKSLMGMWRWMGSQFHNWIDYNEVAHVFNIVTRMGSHIFAFLGVRRIHFNG